MVQWYMYIVQVHVGANYQPTFVCVRSCASKGKSRVDLFCIRTEFVTLLCAQVLKPLPQEKVLGPREMAGTYMYLKMTVSKMTRCGRTDTSLCTSTSAGCFVEYVSRITYMYEISFITTRERLFEYG